MIASSTKWKLMGFGDEQAPTECNTVVLTRVSKEEIKEGMVVAMVVEGSLKTIGMLSSAIQSS